MAATTPTRPSGDEEQEKSQWRIPTILLPSTRYIIEEFGNDVIRMKGQSFSGETDKTALTEEAGTYKVHENQRGLIIDYRAEYGGWGTQTTYKTNPLGEETGEQLLADIEEVLDPVRNEDGVVCPPDVPIQKLVVQFTSDRLQDMANTETNVFKAIYESEKAEGDKKYRPKTKEIFREKGLVRQRFQYRNLNLHSLAEKGSRNALIKWNGKDDTSPVLTEQNDSVAGLVNTEVQPGRYSTLKRFTVGKEDRAVIVE